jgi:hypothetical protein
LGWSPIENEVEANIIAERFSSDLFLSSSTVRAGPKPEEVASSSFLKSMNSDKLHPLLLVPIYLHRWKVVLSS